MASSDVRTSGMEAVEEAAPHRRQISEVTSNFLLINARNWFSFCLTSSQHLKLLTTITVEPSVSLALMSLGEPSYKIFKWHGLGRMANLQWMKYVGFKVILIGWTLAPNTDTQDGARGWWSDLTCEKKVMVSQPPSGKVYRLIWSLTHLQEWSCHCLFHSVSKKIVDKLREMGASVRATELIRVHVWVCVLSHFSSV